MMRSINRSHHQLGACTLKYVAGLLGLGFSYKKKYYSKYNQSTGMESMEFFFNSN